MALGLETSVLKAVSRSFYLSLRLLPPPMRRAAAVAYLLARASDTIADSLILPTDRRVFLLDAFSAQVCGAAEVVPWPDDAIAGLWDEGESELLRRHMELMEALFSLDAEEAKLVKEVVEIIIGGQKLDLDRFGEASADRIVALADEAALDDYTWRVAGCVGVFWTKLGYLTMGKRFSISPQEELIAHAVEYGKALQLVNILRDLPRDLHAGRCYLPVAEPVERVKLMTTFERQCAVAQEKLAHGFLYSEKLCGKRLRLSSKLPAMIARETLEGLRSLSFEKLEEGYKVSRKRIYLMMLGGFLSA